MDRSPSTAAIIVLVLLLPAALLIAGCTHQESLTVRIADHPTYGKLLTDSTGRSLYIQARDVPNTGAVANLGEVGRFYPPFYAESVASGNGINASEFGYLTRADGKQQTTFRGWPLYYYLNDKEPGDAKSQGANNITFLAKPDYTVMVRENATSGIYLSDTTGAALLVRDGAATADPAPEYAPFRASPVVAPAPLVQAGDFAETMTPSGEPQTTYRGQPLFAYTGQGRPGAITGDTGGYRPVILAPGGAFVGAVETPAASPSPSPSPSVEDAAATTAKPTDTAAATATRGGYDSYTGGVHTPTPFRTVQVVSHATDSGTPSSIWTPIVTGAPTAAPATPLTTTTDVPVTPAPTASPTLPPSTPTDIPTPLPTAAPATPLPVTPLPATPPPATPEIPVTAAPTAPPPLPPATPTDVPIPPSPTTVPVPVPISTSPTTIPFPFPTFMPNPAASVQGDNGS